MYSFSKLDKDKFKVVRKEVSTYFGGKIQDDTVIETVKENMNQLMGASDVDTGDFKVYVGDQRLILQLNNELLFESGSAELKEKFKPVIRKMFQSLFSKKKIESIIVEGHTDAVPIKSYIYPSNWELSSARGSRLVREFSSLGIPNEKMVVEGYGDSRPLVPNISKKGSWIPENLKKNRRVLIRVDFGENQDVAQKSLKEPEFVLPKGEKKNKSDKKKPRKPASRNKQASTQSPKTKNLVKPQVKKEPPPIDTLKNKLIEAQKKYKEVQKKAREARKKKAEKEKLLQKIRELEQQTQKLESGEGL